jgi:hypothetical protein
MKLAIVSGKAATGKDYLTNAVLRPKGFFQVSMADHFKVWVVATGRATFEEVYSTKPEHVRKLLQLEGTERGRNVYGEDVWCATALAWMRVFSERNGIERFVIADARFPNEVSYFKERVDECTAYRIVAPERAASSRLTAEQRLHPSETAMDDQDHLFDGFVPNDPADRDTAASWFETLLRAHSMIPAVRPVKAAMVQERPATGALTVAPGHYVVRLSEPL